MPKARRTLWSSTLALSLLASSCSLTSDVSISPLYLSPGDVAHHASGVIDLVEQGDYATAVLVANGVSTRRKLNFKELAALGRAEMASGRFDEARRHLRAALDQQPYRTDAAQIAWDLSQTEYLSNQYAASREWANVAADYGIVVRNWHTEYMTAMSGIDVYRFEGPKISRLAMNSNNPSIPRVNVGINGGDDDAVAVIDSGAVLSIISEEFAQRRNIRTIGDFEGTFYGLLGEPIAVRFGLIETLALGKLVVHNVPVAIMPDAKLNFVIANKKPFRMDLLLGANLLKEFRLQLDFRHARAEFMRLDRADRVLAPNQNLFFVGFRPFVHGTINRKGWFLFVLDTGSEITFLNEEEIGTTPIRNSQKYHAAMLQGLGGATKRGAKIENVALGIDRWSGFFRDLPLYNTEQTRSLGIIGENFLQNFTVTIDFGRMRLDLDRDDMLMTRPAEDQYGGEMSGQ
jgi:hypothetical protein